MLFSCLDEAKIRQRFEIPLFYKSNVEMWECGNVKMNRGFRGFERISRINELKID